jgi:hypothetical protein
MRRRRELAARKQIAQGPGPAERKLAPSFEPRNLPGDGLGWLGSVQDRRQFYIDRSNSLRADRPVAVFSFPEPSVRGIL